MRPNTAFLSAEERRVLNLLMHAADQMTLIFRRQAKATDGLDGPGHGFYPAGLTKAGFEAYLAAHPSEKTTLLNELAVVRRRGDRLVAVPYSREYRSELEKAAVLLERAADVTTNASLKQFLGLRAAAFRSNDYYQSELAWVDVKDTPIEISIGPNGANIDELLGQKAAFRASILVRNSEASAALERYARYLQAMEANLPVADRYKNFKRGSVSPIVVAEQLWHGGASTVGPQGIAFNLPDDERIREAKGARKVVISNVLDAKYDGILKPMIARVLVSDQDRARQQDLLLSLDSVSRAVAQPWAWLDHGRRSRDHCQRRAERHRSDRGRGQGRRHGRVQRRVHDAEGRASACRPLASPGDVLRQLVARCAFRRSGGARSWRRTTVWLSRVQRRVRVGRRYKALSYRRRQDGERCP